MEHRISATDLARSLGDGLGHIRYLGDSFVVERNGQPVARIGPLEGQARATVREAFQVWGDPDPDDLGFADDLERIGASDRPPEDPWAS